MPRDTLTIRTSAPAPVTPGLLALHGNRLELLAQALADWLLRQPLAPLESEVLLVQSNGMAEWLKTALATRLGVCAAVRVELPARFLWTAYRQVLGADAVPATSPLDEEPLTWRLMALLPPLLAAAPAGVYAPLASYLQDGQPLRLLQLARRLADLFDAYQVYRGDWLQAWAQGRDELSDAAGRRQPLPPEQAWQPALWRALLATLPAGSARGSRPQLQQRFVDALEQAQSGTLALPRRVVLFGASHLAPQALQALAAMARHSQVVLVLPNPCRWHWADAIAGREWLASQRRRQPLRNGRDLAALPLEAMHLHAHPLLAAWGRQGRDFLRALDAHDDAALARERFAIPRVDLFDDGPGITQLEQLQAHVRELLPLAETPRTTLPPEDRSISFHVCHSAQREVEVLHDQLLHALAQPAPDSPGLAQPAPAGGRRLQPRDIVVMVPDITSFAPAIHAVFGALPANDPRHIPYGITDLQDRGQHALLRTLEWLLHLPQQRCTLSDLHDLLDLPALAARFGLDGAALPLLTRWMHEAGMRWGLDATQRRALGLPGDDDVHTLSWSLRRMLMGYAVGTVQTDADAPDDGDPTPEPFDEVAGLDAACVGALADLLRALQHWAQTADTPAPPAIWAERGATLLQDFFRAQDDTDERLLASAAQALQAWAQTCADAGLASPLPLEVLREAWLPALQAPGLSRRFRAGGVTFCTLMPLRAIPFQMVCLLGMNEDDYPRRAPRSDFDLMGLPALARPGDRARRDDDRQLMLEALLSARRSLHISWTGRSARDQTEQPPSVLVAQLRDHLAALWGDEALSARTLVHPLQPFSRRYFEAGDPRLFSYAAEWRVVHEAPPGTAPPSVRPAPLRPAAALTLDELARFLGHPARDFFRRQLQVAFDELPQPLPEDEDFALDGLARWGHTQALLKQLHELTRAAPAATASAPDDSAERMLHAALARLQRGGGLPPGAAGRAASAALLGSLLPQWTAWQAHRAGWVRDDAPLPVACQPPADIAAAPALADQITGVLQHPQTGQRRWMALSASALLGPKEAVRLKPLLPAWLHGLASAAAGQPLQAVLVGRDATLTLAPPPAEDARARLQALLALWWTGQHDPIPLPWTTAALFAREAPEDKLVAAYEGAPGSALAEVSDPSLARLWPDTEALLADPLFTHGVHELVLPLMQFAEQVQIEPHPDGAAP